MTTEQEVRGPWSIDEAIQRKAWVVHVETGTVGQMVKFYTGLDDDHYVSTLSKEPIPAPVVELDTGDAFVLKGADTFACLTEAEAAIYASFTQMLAAGVTITAKTAAAAKVPMGTYLVLVRAAIRLQERCVLAALERDPAKLAELAIPGAAS